MKLKVILASSEESGYTAIVPSLPGCISEGETREETLKSILEAIELYLEPVDDDMHSSENAPRGGILLEKMSPIVHN